MLCLKTVDELCFCEHFILIKMRQNERWKSYIFVFYILGQNSYNPFSVPITQTEKLLTKIPRIVFMIFICSIVFNTYIHQIRNSHLTITSGGLIIYISTFAAFATFMFVILSSWSFPTDDYHLIHQCNFIANYLNQNIGVELNFKKFEKKYQRKIMLMFCIYFSVVCVRLCLPSPVFARYAELSHFVLMFYVLITITHILFYVDYWIHLFQSSNMHLETVHANCISNLVPPNVNKLINILRYQKYIHFKLWNCLKLINVRLGWIIIGLLLTTSLDMSTNAYWIFLYEVISKNTYKRHLILRKYRFIFYFFLSKCIRIY